MTEQDIVKVLSTENEEFRKLGAEHKSLKEKLADFNQKVYLTPEEEVEKKRIQKLKLMAKDKMAEFVRQYKKSRSFN